MLSDNTGHCLHVPFEHLKCDSNDIRYVLKSENHTGFQRCSKKKNDKISLVIFYILITYWKSNILDILYKLYYWNQFHLLLFSFSNVATRKFKITYEPCICSLHYILSDGTALVDITFVYLFSSFDSKTMQINYKMKAQMLQKRKKLTKPPEVILNFLDHV